MHRYFSVRGISGVLLSLLLAAAAGAQELGTAVLSGQVTDSQGAVIRGAQVTATNKSRGVTRTAKTGNDGSFVVNDLVPADYELRIQALGFAPFDSSVHLAVGQQTNLMAKLQPAEIKTNVEVHESAQVNTTASVVDGVVNAQEIDNLPLNGRNFLELALLMPGNAPAPNFDPTKSNTVVISSAGQLGRGSSVTIDGSDDNDDAVGGMLLNIPEDAVQEFQIATNRFSAETGRSGSGVANVVTKSGGNTWHGSASMYERDKSLQALPATFDPAIGETPPFRRQQYAGTLGGPVVKDKAWFFSAFEYRDELGGVLVGNRDAAGRTITRSFAPAPLNDGLGTVRGDWQVSNNDALNMRYSIERQDATAASTVASSLGSASERQDSNNHFQDFQTAWTRILSTSLLNRFSFSVNNFDNNINPLSKGPEIDFPSLTDGSSFRVPQGTTQNRLQWGDSVDWTKGKHNFHFGAEVQRIDDEFDLGVFQGGRIVAVEDFPDFDRNGDGVVNDQDVLFAVSIRSAFPNRALVLPDSDNNFVAGYVQDDWRVHPQLTLNLGLRYEIDTDVNNVGRFDQLNPILRPFLQGTRHKDTNNLAPRVGFNWATPAGNFSLHGGYGIYYDRVTLEVQSLERGLDGRALPIDVRLGNVAFINPSTGTFAPGAPTLANAFSGPLIPGAGAAEGMDVISNNLQNPSIQEFNLGLQWRFAPNWIVKADGLHDLGTHFIMGVPVGAVFNPVVGGPEGVTELESAVNTHYDALLVSVDHSFSSRFQFHSAYTLSKSLNYANDDQIPFAYPPLDPTDLHREYGPAPNDQRHRAVFAGIVELPWGLHAAPLWTIASGVPMDILLPDGSTRIPELPRNAGDRMFHNAGELNAFITRLNAAGGVSGQPLPLVDSNARFSDGFNSFDFRLSKDFRLNERMNLQLLGEAFNLFNVTNILGVSNTNYSGFFNTLVRDSNDPTNPGFFHSSQFGKPVTTAGGVFGSGGPRAFQLGAKFSF